MEFRRDENRSVVDNRKPHASDRPAPRQSRPTRKSYEPKKLAILLSISLVVATIISVASWLFFDFYNYSGIDRSRYQAVYLNNENVYFGKVEYLLNGNLLLHDVFRVQAGESNAEKTDNQTEPTGRLRLIKPGKEMHAPDDKMLISRNEVLFIENISADGEVTKAIVEYLKQEKK